jgi:hypothetical protein
MSSCVDPVTDLTEQSTCTYWEISSHSSRFNGSRRFITDLTPVDPTTPNLIKILQSNFEHKTYGCTYKNARDSYHAFILFTLRKESIKISASKRNWTGLCCAAGSLTGRRERRTFHPFHLFHCPLKRKSQEFKTPFVQERSIYCLISTKTLTEFTSKS